MLHNIANKGHRVILAALTAALLVALFSTKAHADRVFSSPSFDYIYAYEMQDIGNLEWGAHEYPGMKKASVVCPMESEIQALWKSHGYYKEALECLITQVEGTGRDKGYKLSDYAIDNFSDSEVPKIKTLHEKIYKPAIEATAKGLNSTARMLADVCAYKREPVTRDGWETHDYISKHTHQEVIKNAEKYLK